MNTKYFLAAALLCAFGAAGDLNAGVKEAQNYFDELLAGSPKSAPAWPKVVDKMCKLLPTSGQHGQLRQALQETKSLRGTMGKLRILGKLQGFVGLLSTTSQNKIRQMGTRLGGYIKN